MQGNWNEAYEEVDQKSIPTNANVIGCHTIYKVKVDHDNVSVDANLQAKTVVVPTTNRRFY